MSEGVIVNGPGPAVDGLRTTNSSNGPVMVLTTWVYKEGLIQAYCLPYLRIVSQFLKGEAIYLFTQEKQLPNAVELAKVNTELATWNIVWCPRSYTSFGWKKYTSTLTDLWSLWRFVNRKKIQRIHCFCTPAGMHGYLLSKLTGKELIIDSYEPHAESMVENGTWSKDSAAFKVLWHFEKKQSARARFCIQAATGMDEYAKKKYGVDIISAGVRPACTDVDRFQFDAVAAKKLRNAWQWEDKIVALYAGKFGGIYLDQEVFDLLKEAYDRWGDRLRVLLLTPSKLEEIVPFCEKAGLPTNIFHLTLAPHDEMPTYLSVADFALCPVKPVPSKRYCTPTKDGEY
ncbi:MAG: hypothetical protein EOO88_49435, partial [Pedobacter sp.]